MAAAGDILVRTLQAARGQGPRRASRPASSTRRPRSSSARRARRRPSRATAASPARSARRRTRWSSTASPGPYALERGDIISRRHRRRRSTAGSPTPPARSRSARSRPVARKLLDVDAGSRCSTPSSSAGPATASATSRTPCRQRVEAEGLSVVRSLVGHGIGRDMHEDPQIPNFGEPGRGPLLEEGMVLAVEPMVTAGRHAVRMGDDGWAIYSQDGSLAAHFEFTIAITADGPADPHAVAPGRPPRRCRAAVAVPHGADWTTLCYRGLPVRARRLFVRAHSASSVAAAVPAARAAALDHRLERDHEGTTVGQADVREVQDHPPPRRGAGDLPEPASQAAAGVALAWHESPGSTSR